MRPLSGLRPIRCPDNGHQSLLGGLVASRLPLAAFARLSLLNPALLARSLLGLSATLALWLDLWLGLGLAATLLPRLLLTAVFLVMTHASSSGPRFAAESARTLPVGTHKINEFWYQRRSVTRSRMRWLAP